MFDFLNISLLKKQIEGFGYHYSFLDFFKSVIIYSGIIIGVSYFHHLSWLYIVILIGTVVMMLPFMIYSQYSFMNESQRFQELCTYLKQMIVNFKTHKKIYTSLKETRNVFDESSPMYECITNAMRKIERGASFDVALEEIEKKYYNSYVNQLHSYLILGEKEGGESVYESLSHIDFQEWQTDTYSFQTQKAKIKKQNGLFAALSLSMTLFLFNFMPADMMSKLYVNSEYQMYTLIYFEIILMAYIFTTAFMNGKWIKPNE